MERLSDKSVKSDVTADAIELIAVFPYYRNSEMYARINGSFLFCPSYMLRHQKLLILN